MSFVKVQSIVVNECGIIDARHKPKEMYLNLDYMTSLVPKLDKNSRVYTTVLMQDGNTHNVLGPPEEIGL